MSLQTIKCPKCNRNLQIEDGTNSFFCNYCGQKIDLGSQNVEKIKENDKGKAAQPQEKLTPLQSILAKLNIDPGKLSIILLIGISVLIIITILRVLIPAGTKAKLKEAEKEMKGIENQVVECINEGDYEKALVYANRLRMDEDYSSSSTSEWNEKREKYISYLYLKLNENVEPVDIEIPFSSKYAQGKKYDDIVQMLRDAGFINITINGIEDDAFIFKKTNKIEKISIDGKTKFDEGTVYKSDVKIIVYYIE